MSNLSPSPASAMAIRTTRSPVMSELRVGCAELYRTATSAGHSTVGTLGNQSASLVVAARPSAGRSPVRVLSALRQRKSCSLVTCSSGTLPVVKYSANMLTRQLHVTGVAQAASRGLGGVLGRASTKVSRCCTSPIGSATSARAAAPKRHLTWRSSGRPKGRHSPLR